MPPAVSWPATWARGHMRSVLAVTFATATANNPRFTDGLRHLSNGASDSACSMALPKPWRNWAFVSDTALPTFSGLPRPVNPARDCISGKRKTPSICAGSMAMAAPPTPSLDAAGLA
jgi:hypothetical protein